MPKLIVTADIHGSYSSWLTTKTLLNSNDKLVIAGDLFDTKYGSFSNADFQPELIKKELKINEIRGGVLILARKCLKMNEVLGDRVCG